MNFPLQLDRFRFTKTTLSNGLDVIVRKQGPLPIVAVNLWYHVGSKNEERRQRGFAHLFEHLMFEGKPAPGAERPGGGGQTFDWSLLSGRRFERPHFLAGLYRTPYSDLACRPEEAPKPSTRASVPSSEDSRALTSHNRA